MFDQENVPVIHANFNRGKAVGMDKVTTRRTNAKLTSGNENKVANSGIPIKRRSSARLAAKKENVVENTLNKDEKQHSSIRAKMSTFASKSTLSKAPQIVAPVPNISEKDLLLNFKENLVVLRGKLLSEDKSLMLLKEQNNEKIISITEKDLVSNKQICELYYQVNDALEGVMPTELLMESYAFALFDYLREREIALLNSLNVKDLTDKMTVQEGLTDQIKRAGTFFRSRTLIKQLPTDQRITIRMRAMVVDWMAKVHEDMNLSAETLFIAVGVMDLFLSQLILEIPKTKLQLIGATCLLIAAKYEEVYPPLANDLAGQGLNYTSVDIVEYERKILQTLRFAVTFPVPLTFLRRYSRLMVTNDLEHSLAKYFCELTVMDLSLSCTAPSLRAAASLVLARMLDKMQSHGEEAMDVDQENIAHADVRQHLEAAWSNKMQFHSGYSMTDVEKAVRELALLVDRQTRPSPLRSIYKKYSSAKYQAIASTPCLLTGLLCGIGSGLVSTE